MPLTGRNDTAQGHEVFDVAIVGAGFAGSALAAVLARRGYKIAVFDAHKIYPEDFRAEKLSGRHLEALRRLGIDASVLRAATFFDDLSIARFGRIVERRRVSEYGIDYAALVAALRDEIGESCCHGGRVKSIETGPHGPTVTLNDGACYAARLVVLATGLGKAMLDGLGIKRVEIARHHSLAVGFDVAVPPGGIAARSLTYHGLSPRDRLAYLTLFPIAERMRANLFLYRRHDEDWARSFRADPVETLYAMMPGLRAMVPGLTVVGSPMLRPIHIYGSRSYIRDGVVLIGDAFETTCPTGGSGISKAVVDIERLVTWIPLWMAQGQAIGQDAIRQFYEDPEKKASDARARRKIVYARSMALAPDLAWIVRRYRNYYGLLLRNWLRSQARDWRWRGRPSFPAE